jgi:hypothetical protein
MTLPQPNNLLPVAYLVRVQGNPAGSFTAEVVGLPELRATTDTREAAIEAVRILLNQRIASGELVVVMPDNGAAPQGSGRRFAGHSKDDPDFDQYLEEIRRFREQADQQQCSSSSSTPTT